MCAVHSVSGVVLAMYGVSSAMYCCVAIHSHDVAFATALLLVFLGLAPTVVCFGFLEIRRRQ